LNRHKLCAVVVAALAGGSVLLGTAGAAVGATAASGCRPGSGRDLAGQHLTSSEVSGFAPGALRCADLAGADLSGLSLAQVDLTGALLRDANLQHADLTQATLSRADLSGANLSGATMIQVTAHGTRLVGADLAGVDFTQADLTGADLSGANLSGTSFDQATLTGANFKGATGVPPYSLYLLIAAGVIFVLLALGSVRRATRAVRRQARQGNPLAAARRPAGLLIRGLVGAFLIAIGFHLFAGGLIDQIVSASGPPLAQTCNAGPLCTVGVAGGFLGLFIGVPILILGIAVHAVRSSAGRALPATGMSFSPASPAGFYQQPTPPGQFNTYQQPAPGPYQQDPFSPYPPAGQ
jgi:hypothetical protein